MSEFAENVIDELNRVADFCVSYKNYSESDDGTERYESIFLGNPGKTVVETIIDNGGIVVDDTHEHGILFCVPYYWILDTDRTLNKGIVNQKSENMYIRLVIPKEKPILVFSTVSKSVIEYKDYDFRVSHTYMVKSTIGFPYETIGGLL